MKLSYGGAEIDVDLNSLIDETVKLAKGLQRHLARLKSMPSLARQRLDEVLIEIDNTFLAVDGAVTQHLNVALDPSVIDKQPDLMLHLSGPSLPMQIGMDRGHCEAIAGVYQDYLEGALDRLLTRNAATRTAVHDIFQSLSEADGSLFDGFEMVGIALQEQAKQALILQLNNDSDGAKALLKRNAAELIEMRQRLQNAHLTLVAIRNEFVKGLSASR
jgi:hypothetical protein